MSKSKWHDITPYEGDPGDLPRRYGTYLVISMYGGPVREYELNPHIENDVIRFCGSVVAWRKMPKSYKGKRYE